ncbi:MAG: thymidylate synthase [Syntrophobacterales bacterium]|nr:thymidylate synthase [Syntrophobacterales bacterium]
MRKIPFEPLYCADRLRIINPYGTLGIITLWSSVDYVERILLKRGVNLDPLTSSIAVMGTLYGNGLRELLRNLLYNPQIDTLILFGRNRSGSAQDLIAFFERGVEPLANSQGCSYSFDGAETVIIRGRKRILDSLVTPEMFYRKPKIVFAGDPQDEGAIERVLDLLENYMPDSSKEAWRRISVPLPSFSVRHYPSNPRNHTIWANDPLTAWKDLIHRLFFFGNPVELRKGRRRELQNVKVVVEHPMPVSDSDLNRYGFDPSYVRRYEKEFLSGKLPEDTSYSYGHRMRTYFIKDQIEQVITRLREDPEDRRSYIVLWDPRKDMFREESVPCLVSIFFRHYGGKLTLTGTFRTHNALDAWLVNFHGLMALQGYIAYSVGMEPGAITVISHSISLDEGELDRAGRIASEKEFRYRLDPMGHFRISIDGDAILVEYCHGDVVLKTYRADRASRLQHEIARDEIISEISHAIYLGRQLERAERCLREGKEFVQD